MVFKKMMSPKFSWEGLREYELLVGLAQEAVTLRDVPQRVLGKIVLQLDTGKYGMLAKFSKEIGVSPYSLRIYSWVERRLDGLEIPPDLPWSSLRRIAGTKDPKAWIKRTVDEGLSFAEVKRQIAEERGDPVKHAHKTVKCEKCGFKTEGIRCGGCNSIL
jgi:hypothetical protein